MANEKNVYLELEGSTGLLFEYSKTEQEGYTRVETENPQTKQTSISYRKYHNSGAYGNLVGFQTREKNMGGKNITVLNIILDNPEKGKTFFITLPWMTSKGSVSDFSVSAISYLPFLEKGMPYRVFPYSLESDYTNKKGKKRKNYGVSIAVARLSDEAFDDVNKVQRLTFETRKANDKGGYDVNEGDIPAVEFEEYMDGFRADSKKRDLYLWNTLKKHYIEYTGSFQKKTFNSKEEGVVRAEYSASADNGEEQQTPAPKTEDKKASKPAKATSVVVQEEEEEDNDNLPF